MKPFLSIFGGRSDESPLDGLPVLFPHGTPSREIVTRDEPAAVAARSGSWSDFVTSFGALAIGSGIVSRTEAWKNPHVRRCVEATSQAIASLPFTVSIADAPAKKHWWLDFVMAPNEFVQMTEHDLKEQTVAVRELFGECFWFLDREDAPTRSGKKAPISRVWIYHPHAVSEAIDRKTGLLLGWFFQFENERFFVDRLDVVQFRRYDPMRHNPRRPARGTSPLDAAMLAVSTDIAASKYNLDFFNRGFAPGVILMTKEEQEIDPNASQRLAERLRGEYGGKNNGVAILDGGQVSVLQVSQSQRDSEFIAGARKSMNEIAEIFGTPPCVLGNQDAKYDNAEMQLLLWWDGPLANIRANLVAAINNGPLKAEANVTADLSTSNVEVLQKRKRERVATYVNLITSARHSPKVASQIVGLEVDPTMPGYEDVLVGYNQIPYDLMTLGASVMVNPDVMDPKDPASEPTPTPAPKPAEPKPPADPKIEPEDEEPRTIRVLEPLVRVVDPLVSRAQDDDEILRLLLRILEGDDEKLKKTSRRFHLQAIETGAQQIGKLLGLEALVAIDNPAITRFLEERGNLIVSVNRTTAERINRVVRSLMDEGAAPEEIGRAIKDTYNLRDKQARLIARQEVGSGLSGGRFIQMEEAGAEKTEWMSSQDHRVRESHQAIDGEIVKLGELFSNGLRFPQDPDGDPSEVIGCRCIASPVIDSRSLFQTEERRVSYWRAAVGNVRTIETGMTAALQKILFTQRREVLRAFADAGIAK